MHFKIFIAGALASCALLSACTSDELPLPEEELYAREFVKEFGLTDPAHDYNMAQSSGIKVITSAPTDLKVYAKVDGRTYLFAEGRKVSGTTAIPFSVPKGVTEVMVKVGNTIKTTSLGQTLDLRGVSRTFGEEDSSGDGNLTFKITDLTYLSPDAIRTFMKNVPEEKVNIDKVVSDFYFISNGEPIKFYPIYWNTSSFHALGVYWLDADGKFDSHNMKDVYYTKSGELEWSIDYSDGHSTTKVIKCWTSSDKAENEVCTEHNAPVLIAKEGEKITIQEPSYAYDLNKGDHYHIITPEQTEGTWQKCNISQSEAYALDKITGIRTKGMEITIPKGEKFGFYLKVNATNTLNPNRDNEEEHSIHHIYFSQALRNQIYGTPSGATDIWNCTNQVDAYDKPWTGDNLPSGYEEYAYSRASYKTIDLNGAKYTFFAFEDWPNKPDLNDVVFMFDTEMPELPKIVDDDNPEPTPDDVFEWIIAAEDLGGTYDWDFNDAVFSVKAKTIVAEGEETKTEITVEPLAAGGTMPVYIMFDGAIDGTDACYHIGTEIHSWFGNNTMKPINAGPQADATAKALTFTVTGEWSLNSHQNDGSWTSEGRNMGGFWLLADPEGTVTGNSGTTPQVKAAGTFDGEAYKVTAPQFGENYEAPQMFCLTGDWQWPQEHKNITDAYAAFNDWMGDKTVKWYGEGATFDESLIVKRTK